MKPKSLEGRLLLYLSIIAVFVFVLTEALFMEKSRRSLIRMLDKDATSRVGDLAVLIMTGLDGKTDGNILDDFGGVDSSSGFLIYRLPDKVELKRSESLKGINITLLKSLSGLPRGKPYFWDMKVKHHGFRFVAVRETAPMEKKKEGSEAALMSGDGKEFADTGGNDYLFIVGMSKRYMGKRLRGTFEATAPALGVGLAAMLLLGWLVIRRGLGPLLDLEEEVQSISSSRMIPVTVPEVKELSVVATTLNGMIRDLREAFERERRFTANVAHELRTRISEMRSLAEVALKFEDDLDGATRKNYEDILASAKEMQKTVINLLTLARCHSGQLTPQKETLLLQPFVDSIWKEQAEEASARGLTVSGEIPPDLAVNTDRDLFAIVLQNLFSNAVSYAARGGRIEWKAEAEEDNFTFSISNSVDNFSETDLTHIFELFWRKDQARSSGSDHSGLGLSLVESLAEVLCLSISARLTSPSFLTIALSGRTNQPV